MIIHGLLVIAAIFENNLYVIKPEKAAKCHVSFYKQGHFTEWKNMEMAKIDSHDVFKFSHNSSDNIISFKIKLYAPGMIRESSVIHLLNGPNLNLKTERMWKTSLILNSFTLAFLIVFLAASFYRMVTSNN